MSERLDMMLDRSKSGDVVEKIKQDPVEAKLFEEYISSLKRSQIKPANDLLQKRLGGAGLSPAENVQWQSHVNEYVERTLGAKRMIANLNDRDVSQLGEILGNTVATVDKKDLPLYLLGLGIKKTPDFDVLAKKVSKWKGSARNDRADDRADYWKGIADKLAPRYGISREELHRFMHTADDGERYREIKDAIRTSGWMKTVFDIARQRHLGTRAGGLNEAITEYRKQAEGMRKNVDQVFKALCSFDTRDSWWTGLDETLLTKKAMDLTPEKRPLTIEAARQKTSPDAVRKAFEEDLGALGGQTLTAVRAARDKHVRAGTPDDLWAEMVDVNGTQRPISDLYSDFASKYESSLKTQGWISKFFEALFKPMIRSRLTQAKTHIQNA